MLVHEDSNDPHGILVYEESNDSHRILVYEESNDPHRILVDEVSNYPVPPCGTAHGGTAFQRKIVPNWKMFGGSSLCPAIIRHSGLNNIVIA